MSEKSGTSSVKGDPKCETNPTPKSKKVPINSTIPLKKSCQLAKSFWDEDDDDADATPQEVEIFDLKPGIQKNRFIIVRISYCGKLKYCSPKNNVKHEIYNFNGMGKSGEISVVAYGETAVKLSNIIKENVVYKFSNFVVKVQEKKYRQFNTVYNLVLNSATQIDLEVESGFPELTYNYTKIQNLLDLSSDYKSAYDLLAIVGRDIGISKHMGKYVRDLILTDDSSKHGIVFRLWGESAKDLNIQNHDVIVIRRLAFRAINGQPTIESSSRFGTYIQINPSSDDAEKLLAWFHNAWEKKNSKKIENK